MQRIRCWRCAEVQAPAFFCASCGAIQPLPADVDYFVVLGFPSHPDIDERALETRYYELSRKLHPDRFQTASPEEQKASVQAASLLNSAFQTLRTSQTRGRYWLRRLGEDLGKENQQVPPELAALVFEVQEKLADLRGGDQSERAASRGELMTVADDVERRVAAAEGDVEDLLRRWPKPNGATASGSEADVRNLKRALAELAYLRTLDRDVRAAVED
jgi:molecular chaperone HscB